MTSKEKKYQTFYITQGIVLIRNNKALILEEGKYPGKWILPGGHVDKQEKTTDALKREIVEEVGTDAFEIYGIVDSAFMYRSSRQAVCRLVYCGAINSDQVQLSSEHQQFKWITEDEIMNYDYSWSEEGKAIKKAFEMYKKENE